MLAFDRKPAHVDTLDTLVKGNVVVLKMPLDKFKMDCEMLAILSELVVVVNDLGSC